MKDIPKHILVTVIIMVVVGLLGGAAWYWTSTQLTQKLEEKSSLEGEIAAIEKKAIFPSAQNKKVLDDYKAKLKGLDEGLVPEVKSRIDLFSAVRTVDPASGAMKGLDPDGWKKEFGDKRQALRQLAKDKNLAIPDEYNFGFKSYVLAAPRADNTLDLGIQLLAIEEIFKVLANSGVESVSSIKRSMVEDASKSGSGSSSGTGNDEAINARVLAGPEGLYRVLPFEIALKADPQAITKVLNGFSSSKFLFVTRFVYLENEKNAVPKRSEVTGVSTSGPTTVVEGAPAVEKKNFISVAGQEKVNAKIRIDLIDLLPPVSELKAPKPKK